MRTTFTLKGVHCSACAAVIPVLLQVVDGIEQASMEDDQLTVTYNKEKIQTAEIIGLLEDAGYTAETVGDQ